MHHLIIGQTGAGKSTYAQFCLTRWMSAGRDAVVIDSSQNFLWRFGPQKVKLGSYLERDVEIEINRLKKSFGKLVIIDESASTLDRWDLSQQWLGTQSRHRGHSVMFLVQRYQMLDPTVRGQCESLVCFNLHREDAQNLGREFNCPNLELYAPRLKPLCFIQIRRFKSPCFGRITGQIPYHTQVEYSIAGMGRRLPSNLHDFVQSNAFGLPLESSKNE